MNNIILAHFNENIDWFKSLNGNFNKIVYSKTIKNGNYYIKENRSQEVPMYLRYIIDYYDSMPEKTLFLHAHLTSPHQTHDSKFICERVNWNCDTFFSVNRRDWYQELSLENQVTTGSYDLLKSNWTIFSEFLTFPEKLLFYSSAQFVVDRELILQYPKNFYNSLYKWSITNELSDYMSSRIFEYVWHYLFTKNTIEKVRQEKEIFNYEYLG